MVNDGSYYNICIQQWNAGVLIGTTNSSKSTETNDIVSLCQPPNTHQLHNRTSSNKSRISLCLDDRFS